MKIAIKFILLLSLVTLLSCKNNDEADTSTASYAGENFKKYQLEGTVLNIPNNKKLELMLFSIDGQDRPRRLLVSKRYNSNGNVISFQLPFELNQSESFKHLELRGRVIENGKPVEFLTPWKGITKDNLKGVVLKLNT